MYYLMAGWYEIEALEEKAKTIVISDFDKEVESILKKYL
ncbi:hypothetical protein EZS27_015854 [termite gut metagenome]|uniref:Uncharacterized protein n=1 Tax=termite gut metagenome TaxID=433724 RepID=A0A5J4RQP2_9ZZZZ